MTSRHSKKRFFKTKIPVGAPTFRPLSRTYSNTLTTSYYNTLKSGTRSAFSTFCVGEF